MDIEDLNKSQIILLTLLVSFVTSIATGIVTVSLMEKAPKDVVRVVQRVVEKTVEQVDSVAPTVNTKEVIVQEKTVIVDQTDKLSQAVSVNKGKVVKIYEKDTDEFVAFGIATQPDTVLTDAGVLDNEKKYIISISSSEFRDVEVVKLSGARAIAKLQLNSQNKLKTAEIGSEKDIKLGTKVFMFDNKELNAIKTGIVSQITPSLFSTDMNIKDIIPGTPVFDYEGNLIGMSTSVSREDSVTSFIKSTALEAVDAGDLTDADTAGETGVASKPENSSTSTTQSASAQGAVQ